MPGPVFLSNEHVSLRTVEAEDCSFLHEAISSPDIWRPMHSAKPTTLKEIRDTVETDGPSSSVRLLIADGSTPVGLLGFSDIERTAGVATISYWIHPDHWGTGYGTEAVELFVEYGFEQLGLHKVVAEVIDFNEVSKHLLEKIGFVEEGRQREQDFVDGEYHDCVLYGLLASEWRDQRRS